MKPKVSVFVIATNTYTEYAFGLIQSALKWINEGFHVQFIILTDEEFIVPELNKGTQSVEVASFQIPPYGWPEATLMRFHLMVDHWEHATGDIVMYLDADTEIVAPLKFDDLMQICMLPGSNGFTPVLHPGYYKRSLPLRLFNRTKFGPWETDRASAAYVPIQSRQNYVCGGVFWGLNEAFFQLCTHLKAKIDVDIQNGITAKHHDESHLNNWFVSHSTISASPEWAYAQGYRNLSGLQPKIEVIHKPQSFVRIPTKI